MRGDVNKKGARFLFFRRSQSSSEVAHVGSPRGGVAISSAGVHVTGLLNRPHLEANLLPIIRVGKDMAASC